MDSVSTPYKKMLELIKFYEEISEGSEDILILSNSNTNVLRSTIENLCTEQELQIIFVA